MKSNWPGGEEEKRKKKKKKKKKKKVVAPGCESGQGQNVVEPSRIIFSASYYCANHKSVKCLGSRLNETVHRYTLLSRDSQLSASNANFCRFIHIMYKVARVLAFRTMRVP